MTRTEGDWELVDTGPGNPMSWTRRLDDGRRLVVTNPRPWWRWSITQTTDDELVIVDSGEEQGFDLATAAAEQAAGIE